MLSSSQLSEIVKRVEADQAAPYDEAREDRALLVAEVDRLNKFLKTFSDRVTEKLDILDADMLNLEKENERLRKMNKSSNIERDACIGLLSKMALLVGLPVGIGKFEVSEETSSGEKQSQLQNRIVIDLPSGQVSWDFLDSESHLFEGLPPYGGVLENQTIQENYSKVMNPHFEVSLQTEN
jgi:hypothetical protein